MSNLKTNTKLTIHVKQLFWFVVGLVSTAIGLFLLRNGLLDVLPVEYRGPRIMSWGVAHAQDWLWDLGLLSILSLLVLCEWRFTKWPRWFMVGQCAALLYAVVMLIFS